MSKEETLFYRAARAQKQLSGAVVRFSAKPSKETRRELARASKRYYKIGAKLNLPVFDFSRGPAFVGMK